MSSECPKYPLQVYILFFISKTWTELLGVYSTDENARNAYNKFMSSMGGASNCNGLTVCVRKMDENYVTAPLEKSKSPWISVNDRLPLAGYYLVICKGMRFDAEYKMGDWNLCKGSYDKWTGTAKDKNIHFFGGYEKGVKWAADNITYWMEPPFELNEDYIEKTQEWCKINPIPSSEGEQSVP